MDIRVAGAQIEVCTDVAANVAAIRRGIHAASDTDADVLLTPEGSLSGYYHSFDPEEVASALGVVCGEAAEAGIALALGTCFVEPDDGLCYNQIRFYSAEGEHLGSHAKTLRCGSLERPPKGEIERFAGAPLRTFSVRGAIVGGLICNDMWANPQCTPMPDSHLSQQLSERGARIVFHAVNGGRSDSEWSRMVWNYHETNLRMRARAGGLWVVTVDNCAPPERDCSAPSGVVDPEGNWACRCPPRGEAFFTHTVSL